jgi:hypothetical protein
LNQPNRPSTKELSGKLSDAIQVLSDEDGLFADPGKVVWELNALGIDDSKEVWDLIRQILPEIKPEHYTGSRPPQKSYEKSIEGRELFAFSWESTYLGKKMYLKFALKNERFYYVSLHHDKPPKPLRKGQT